MNNLKVSFDPTKYADCELYMQRLIMIKDELKKKLQRQKNKKIKKIVIAKTLRF